MRNSRQIPDKSAVKKFIDEQQAPVGRREIARAFGIKGSDRIKLRGILKELTEDGVIGRRRGRRYTESGTLPPVAVLQISSVDDDAILHAEPIQKHNEDKLAVPKIAIRQDRHGVADLGIGDKVLARLKKKGNGYEATIIRVLPKGSQRVIGVYVEVPGQGARIRPTDKRHKSDYSLDLKDNGGAKPGDLVVANILNDRRHGLHEAQVSNVIGDIEDRRAISLIAIHSNDIPDVFSGEAISEATAAKEVTLDGRLDLRHLPLVTVDGADARDFDDAIFAMPDDDPQNLGGWQIIVAIADVAYYVTYNSALDREARKRGNSVYFPDRVVPMLPEELSNNLCSLRPGEDRPVLAITMRLDENGHRMEHTFHRAIIRSAARIIYEDLQAAYDGEPNEQTELLLNNVIQPLFGAWKSLMRAREARSPLDLDLPEMNISLSEEGEIIDVRPSQRLDAHRVIEEFMIEANVAAAETLEGQNMPCIYRVHDAPDKEKLTGLKEFLSSLNLSLTLGERMRPELFNRILVKAKGSDHWHAVNQSILRAQSQARYDTNNIGHFGLARSRYAHFTSPIRRYADLLVHRALIRGGDFGNDGLSAEEASGLSEISEHISNTERRAMVAERDANDRYMAAFMSERTGAEFDARINGITRAGLFLTLLENGADGLLPMRYLYDDYYEHDARQNSLVGERSGTRYRLGDTLRVRLAEVNALTGGLIFELPKLMAESSVGMRGRARVGRLRNDNSKRIKTRKHSKRKGRRRTTQ